MKKFVNHTAAFLLALALLISLFPMTAFAAESWPRLSPTGFCEMVAPAKVNVYMDSSLSTRGAVGSEQSYNAYVASGDLIRIYQVTSDYTLLKYPTSNGRRAGYVRTSDLFGRSEPAETVTSVTKVTTYTNNNASTKSGSVAAGDSVYRLGSASGDYILIMYTAESGARAYKAAFVTRSDYDKIKGSSSSTGSGSSNSSSGTQSMSYALYNGNGGRVTCGFDAMSIPRADMRALTLPWARAVQYTA